VSLVSGVVNWPGPPVPSQYSTSVSQASRVFQEISTSELLTVTALAPEMKGWAAVGGETVAVDGSAVARGVVASGVVVAGLG
jgi:hypothetical protein